MALAILLKIESFVALTLGFHAINHIGPKWPRLNITNNKTFTIYFLAGFTLTPNRSLEPRMQSNGNVVGTMSR